MRYSFKSLEEDLVRINYVLTATNSNFRLVAESRNGYSAVDIATPEQLEQYCSSRAIVTGTPRECFEGASHYFISQMLNHF